MSTTPPDPVSDTKERDPREAEAENLILWACARAGMIVLTPFLGTVALTANEVYMIARIAKVYGITLTTAACGALLGGLGGAFAGGTLATLLPLPPLQIPIGVGVTYAVGQIAHRWIRDGMPADLTEYRKAFEKLCTENWNRHVS